MILPDVNVLVYAYRREAELHEAYATWLQETLEGQEDLALVDAVLTGFLRLVTNRRAFADPAPTEQALSFVEELRRSDPARHVGGTDDAWRRLGAFITSDRQIKANLVPDAWLAAVATSVGARIATADTGFARFPGLVWFDPIA